ncbi:MAG: F0F1 ATP synthase subunit gamma [Magnetospirillum sp.]|jgi:F-type H+-transporting ATPase subunit gamma|nr:F0F1 ATP synthase subunit gamma [Magnetospirillum sp.]
MATLKALRMRIASVKSTQKITSAMKMVAAAKLRRAQEQAEAARPYALRMGRMLGSLAASMTAGAGAPKLLAGTGADKVHLLVVATSDRGLCGGFNSTIVRLVRSDIRKLQAEGKTVKLLCVGRKGREQLRRDYANLIVGSIDELNRKRLSFADATRVSDKVLAMFDAGEFDVCAFYYARFKSAISQIPTRLQLVPFVPSEAPANDTGASYEYEPEEGEILEALLPRNLAVQVYGGLLENGASEQGARMSAMDSATRNAGDMIKKLTLNYNRSRQASITKELIEIISGAEAV